MTEEKTSNACLTMNLMAASLPKQTMIPWGTFFPSITVTWLDWAAYSQSWVPRKEHRNLADEEGD
ncbi:hypothetical protein MUP01_05110 [Candidatus Bathyarchaeota archaeon]|nr:hypothetical protein [Candidatus Bathyarchaeota archaeon]